MRDDWASWKVSGVKLYKLNWAKLKYRSGSTNPTKTATTTTPAEEEAWLHFTVGERVNTVNSYFTIDPLFSETNSTNSSISLFFSISLHRFSLLSFNPFPLSVWDPEEVSCQQRFRTCGERHGSLFCQSFAPLLAGFVGTIYL